MTAYLHDEPVYNSYVEAYLANNKINIPPDAGSRTSTAPYGSYGYGPSASAQRLRGMKSFVDCNPSPVKTISVLHRPVKPPSGKNAENLDVQHERDTAAFDRRARVYQRHATKPYHHHAPPGSILTMFEQGHIVDRGRGKSTVQESRGVYDPVVHSYRIDPATESAPAPAAISNDRPRSAPHRRTSTLQQPQPGRFIAPFEHKKFQASRGTYNPLTHTYANAPDHNYVRLKEREFDRRHGLGNRMRRVPNMQAPTDPILWTCEPPSSSVATLAPELSATTGLEGGGVRTTAGIRRQRPSSAPGPLCGRKSAAGPAASGGIYNPLTHQWHVPPSNPNFEKQEAVRLRRLGLTGSSTGRTHTARQHGVYNPILNTWTVPPANPRLLDGLAFMPATLFSRPTAATIRM